MLACPSCGTENPPEAKFCSECGNPLAESAPAREVRKTVTVLFCDVTGSTELGERLDPESLRGAMERYFDLMHAVLEAHGGTVEKFIGDAIMAVFGVPRIHEDDAVRAIRAAAEMRDSLEALNRDLDAELGIRIVVRTGVNTGQVVAGERGADQRLVTGDAVNTAARLEQAADPGEILLGEGTYDLVRDAVDVEPVDPLALKGKAEAVGAYRLLSVRKGVAGHERKLDAPMIGRERQLRTLLDAFEGVVADRTCHLFTVLGPAGIGKSRLVREFGSRMERRAAFLTGRCLSYGEGITLWPVVEMAIQAAGIKEEDPPEEARTALRSALRDAPDADAIASQLADLLGMGRGGPVEASWAIRRFLEALASDRPVVAVLDDIHWAEPTLLDVVEHVADWSRDAPILLLCMARPELLEDRPGWAGGKRNATSVHLEPLSEPEADSLIENLLGHPALTPEIRERIRAAAQGNPLFVEEMLQMLLDEGVLVQKEDEWVATVDLTTVQVPPAISALLAARVDRLSPDGRVLEAASVVGEVFEPEAVRALVDGQVAERVQEVVGSLLRKDLVRPSASDVGATEAVRFRHILLRDAVYDAIPKAERAALHEAFADHLGGALGERAAEFDEFIGYHLERSHRLRMELGQRDERTERIGRRASGHLADAGQRAFQRGDMGAAANVLGRAADLLPPDDPERLRMAWRLGYALTESGAIAPAIEILEATVELARQNGDERAGGYAESALWIARIVSDPDVDVDRWASDADRLVTLFEELGDAQGAALAWMQKAIVSWFGLQLAESGRSAAKSIEYASAAGDAWVESEMRGQLMATSGLGPLQSVEEALAMHLTALKEARARGQRRLEQNAIRGIGAMNALLGRFEEAHHRVAEGRAILLELGMVIDYWSTAQLVAFVCYVEGDEDRGARELREACEQLEALGETAFLSTTAAELASTEIRRGLPDEAERWLRVAERTASSGDTSSQVWIELVRGQLLAPDGDEVAARHLREAVRLMDEGDSPVWRSDARLRVARALGPSLREEAIAYAREALDLSDAKGAVVFARRAHELLETLGADRP